MTSDASAPFGLSDALEVLQRSALITVEVTRHVPLRVYPEATPAVVALEFGAGPELVVKIDEPAMLATVASFHDAYHHLPLLPTLRYVDPTHRFLAYDFAAGELGRGMDPPPDKAATLVGLVDGLLSHYLPAASGHPGWLHAPWLPKNLRPRTWQQLLGLVLHGRHDQVHAHLPPGAKELVQRLAVSPFRRGQGPLYLMHGDCGAHNFVFRDGVLSAVIDPAPMVGEPIFELAFAFASWPADLTLDAIAPAAEKLERSGRWRPPPDARHRALIEEILVALYSRVGTFVLNRPGDVPPYVDAWSYWTALLSSA